MAKAKPTTIVMHPLPRNKELDEALDFDVKRAAYFRQMRYGLYVSVDCCAQLLELMTDYFCRSAWRFLPSLWATPLHKRLIQQILEGICPVHGRVSEA